MDFVWGFRYFQVDLVVLGCFLEQHLMLYPGNKAFGVEFSREIFSQKLKAEDRKRSSARPFVSDRCIPRLVSQADSTYRNVSLFQVDRN